MSTQVAPAAEVARPPQPSRRAPVDAPEVQTEAGDPNDPWVYITVTETVNMRNAGTGPSTGLRRQGWIDCKGEEAQMSPDGSRFRMKMRKSDLDAKRARNNQRARMQEGFKPDHEIVKDMDASSEPITGQEMFDELKKLPPSAPADAELNG